MMTLKDILHGIPVTEIIGELNRPVTEVCFDSRKAVPDCLFVAVKGTRVDGNEFIAHAIDAGAATIICDKLPEAVREGITYIVVGDIDDSQKADERDKRHKFHKVLR